MPRVHRPLLRMVVRTDQRLVRAKLMASQSSTGPIWPTGTTGRQIVYFFNLISRQMV